MSFQALNVYIDRGQFNSDKTEQQLGEHSYLSLDDDLATIASLSTPYFPNFLSDTAEDVKDGDLLLVSAADGFRRYKIVQNADPVVIIAQEDVITDPTFHTVTITDSILLPAPGAPSTSAITYFSDKQAVPLLMSGPFAVPISVSAVATRVNDLVSLYVPSFSGTQTIDNQIITATLPSWLNTTEDFTGIERSGLVAGLLTSLEIVTLSGVLNIKVNNNADANFHAVGNVIQTKAFNITYFI